MRLLIALTLSLAFASAAHADYTYTCTSFGSSDTYQLEIDDFTAMITSTFGGTRMAYGQDGKYSFNGMIEIGNHMYFNAVLTVPEGMVGSSWLRGTVGDGSWDTSLDCTLK